MNNSALDQYRSVSVQSGITDATAHHMISMLLDGALGGLASAKGAVMRRNVGVQGEQIGKSIRIIDTLRASLDHERGGEISSNLASLYDYMEQRLLEANIASDVKMLDEVISLLKEVRSGWDTIPQELRGKS
ncbi:MAG: flagellar protein FliS [Alcanivorax sp.]|jgi:flagellar protein FliS